MLAIVLQSVSTGPVALQLRSIDTPKPGPDQVLIQVYAAGVNPVDWKRAAAGGVPGFDAAGIVDAVGPGVTTFKPGDAVVARANGAYAQYVLATLDSVVLKPGSFTFGQAAGITVAGIAHLSRGSRGEDQARPAGGGDRCRGRRGLAPPWTPPCPWGDARSASGIRPGRATCAGSIVNLHCGQSRPIVRPLHRRAGGTLVMLRCLQEVHLVSPSNSLRGGMPADTVALMSKPVDRIQQQIRDPSTAEKEEVLHTLLDELEGPSDEEVEAAWLAEVERRAREINNGTVQCIPATEVFSRLDKILGK
jgi:hypothetical protein